MSKCRLSIANISGVVPSGFGRSMSAPASRIARTQRVQPERAAKISGVKPPVGRYWARGSDVTCAAPVVRDGARVHVGAVRDQELHDVRRVAVGRPHERGLLFHDFGIDVRAVLDKSFATSVAPARAASINAVSPSWFGDSALAPASSSVLTSPALPIFTASASGLEPYLLTTSAFAPRFKSCGDEVGVDLVNGPVQRRGAVALRRVDVGAPAIAASAASRSPAWIRSANPSAAAALPAAARETTKHPRSASRVMDIGRAEKTNRASSLAPRRGRGNALPAGSGQNLFLRRGKCLGRSLYSSALRPVLNRVLKACPLGGPANDDPSFQHRIALHDK